MMNTSIYICTIVYLLLHCSYAYSLNKDQSKHLINSLGQYVVLETTHVQRLLSIEQTQDYFHHDLVIQKDLIYSLQLKPLKIHHDNFRSVVFDHDGNKHIQSAQELDLDCMYHGSIVDQDNSSVLLSLCGGGIHARIRNNSEESHIQTIKTEDGTQQSLYFRTNDIKEQQVGTCGNKDHESVDLKHVIPAEIQKRENNDKTSETESTHGRKLEATELNMELVVVNSASRFAQHGDNLLYQTFTIVGLVQELYDDLAKFGDYHLKITIIKTVSFTKDDPQEWYESVNGINPLELDGKVHADILLENFGTWSKENLGTYDAAHLLHGTDFYSLNGQDVIDGVVGYATTGGACFTSQNGFEYLDYRTGVTQATSTINQNIANTMAHELGHNVGMGHADENGCDDNDSYVMNSVTSTTDLVWSSCSNNDLVQFLTKQATKSCLTGGETTSENSVCGNGIVEEDEDCDCPLGDCSITGASYDPCCNGSTCKFVGDAVCSALQPCCTDSCTFVEANAKTCRAAKHSFCDIEEKCDGTSGSCPVDQRKVAGTSCEDSPNKNDNNVVGNHEAGACFEGQCIGRNQQCVDVGLEHEQYNEFQTSYSNDCGSIVCINFDLQIVTLSNQFYKAGTPCCEQDTDCDLQDLTTRKICSSNTKDSKCVDASIATETFNCTNLLTDYSETDIDCGGPHCDACDQGLKCKIDVDCVSPYSCEYNSTISVEFGFCMIKENNDPCNNDQTDPSETDVDCGGPLCEPCGRGETCIQDSDCLSPLICAVDALSTSGECMTKASGTISQSNGKFPWLNHWVFLLCHTIFILYVLL